MALFRCSGGGGGTLTGTTLWTNSTPAVSFVSQQITLSQSVENFRYIGIKYRASISNDATIEIILTPTDLQKSVSGSTEPRISMSANNSSYRYDRGVAYDNTTHITFGQANRNGGTGNNNGLAIPTEVTGYN